MKTVRIRDREIGDGAPPYFIAEHGTCHRGSVEIVRQNTLSAVQAGADCIKTETFYETEIFDESITKTWSIRGKKYELPLREHMRKTQLTLDQHHEIKKYCDELGVPFMATAHEFEVVAFLQDIGAVAVKVASPDIVHYPLLSHIAKTDLVLFIDTGGAYQTEVENAVKTAIDYGCKDIIVNHNPAGHPAPPEGHDLKIIPRFKELFGIPIGLSDHYDGYEMCYAAVAVGANVIEKPVSEDRFYEDCEYIWSISRKDLREVITNIKNVYLALGNSSRAGAGLSPSSIHRVALVAKMDLDKGDELTLDTVTFGKPRNGIGVENWDLVEGRKLKVMKTRGSYIKWEDL